MKYTAYISIIFLSIGLYACDTENQNNPSGSHLKSGQIEIKVHPGKNNEAGFTVIADKLTIDWGDGHVEQFTEIHPRYSHQYANQDLQTITIQTEQLIWFETMLESISIDDKRLTWGYFREIRFGEMNALARLSLGCPTLSVLEIEKAGALTHFNCSGQLTSLDVSGLTALEEFRCSGHPFTSLDLRSLRTLKSLSCSGNQLTSLDVSGLTALSNLDCVDNQLTTINVTGCTSLGSLDCSRNQLTSLDVSSLTSLSSLLCFNNQLTSDALNAIFEDLPERMPETSILIIENNPGFDTCNREIAINKGWYFVRMG